MDGANCCHRLKLVVKLILTDSNVQLVAELKFLATELSKVVVDRSSICMACSYYPVTIGLECRLRL